MSLFASPDATSVWGNPNCNNAAPQCAPLFAGAQEQQQQQQQQHSPANNAFTCAPTISNPQQPCHPGMIYLQQPNHTQQQFAPSSVVYPPATHAACNTQPMQPAPFAAPTGPVSFVQLPNGQLVLHPQQTPPQFQPLQQQQLQYQPQQFNPPQPMILPAAPALTTWSQPPGAANPASHGGPLLCSPQLQPPQVRRQTSGKKPATQPSNKLPQDQSVVEPRAFSANGSRSSLVAPSVEPLRAMSSDLCHGLQLRDVTTVSNATTPIDVDRIDSLIALTYKSFVTDRDLMVFVKEHFSVELCLQIRDRITIAHTDAMEQAATPAEAALAARRTVLGIDMVERRGALTVSLVEVLCTMPTPCSHEEQFEGATDHTKNLTSFCPLTRAVFRSLFDACVTSPRGCIALLRLFSSTSTAPRPVDSMVRHVTARLETLVFDSHANYIVSHILCTCELSTADPRERVFTPVPHDEMIARTPTILALAAVNNKASSNGGDKPETPSSASLPPRRIAAASAAVWNAFVAKLAQVLTADVVRTGTHREASHILEHAIRRFDFKRVPAAAVVVSKLTTDTTVLLPLAQSNCGRHCVRALAETLASRGGDLPYDTLRAAVACLRALQARVVEGELQASVTGFDAVDAALRRLPELE